MKRANAGPEGAREQKSERKRNRQSLPQPPRRRRRHGRRGLYAAAAFLIIIAAGAALCCTVFFRIEKVELHGDSGYTEEQIKAAGGIAEGARLMLFSGERAAALIQDSLPYAETVQIRKKLPDTLVVTAEAPRLRARVNAGTGMLLISGKGRILEEGYEGGEAEYLPEDPRVSGGYVVFGEGELEGCNSIYAAASAGGVAGVTAVSAAGGGAQAYFVYDGRVKVKLGGLNGLEYKMKFAKYFIENGLGADETGVADVSKGGTLHFNPGEWREKN